MTHAHIQYNSNEDQGAVDILQNAYHQAGFGTTLNNSPALPPTEFGGPLGHIVVIVGGEHANPVYQQFHSEGVVGSAVNGVLHTVTRELSGDFLGALSPFSPEQVTFIAGNTASDTMDLAQTHALSISPTIPAAIGGGLGAVGGGIQQTGEQLFGGITGISQAILPLGIIAVVGLIAAKLL